MANIFISHFWKRKTRRCSSGGTRLIRLSMEAVMQFPLAIPASRRAANEGMHLAALRN